MFKRHRMIKTFQMYCMHIHADNSLPYITSFLDAIVWIWGTRFRFGRCTGWVPKIVWSRSEATLWSLENCYRSRALSPRTTAYVLEFSFLWLRSVKRFCRKGIPPEFRGHVWMTLSGAYDEIEKHPDVYKTAANVQPAKNIYTTIMAGMLIYLNVLISSAKTYLSTRFSPLI